MPCCWYGQRDQLTDWECLRWECLAVSCTSQDRPKQESRVWEGRKCFRVASIHRCYYNLGCSKRKSERGAENCATQSTLLLHTTENRRSVLSAKRSCKLLLGKGKCRVFRKQINRKDQAKQDENASPWACGGAANAISAAKVLTATLADRQADRE